MAQANQAALSHGAMPMAAGLSLENRLIKPRARVTTLAGFTARSYGGRDAFMRFLGSIPFPLYRLRSSDDRTKLPEPAHYIQGIGSVADSAFVLDRCEVRFEWRIQTFNVDLKLPITCVWVTTTWPYTRAPAANLRFAGRAHS
jgi:hypothetical protein